MTDERDADVKKLWDAYFEEPNIENNNRLIEHYLYLVKSIVLRMSPLYKTTFRDYDDLISNGILGLMDAIRKFDRKRNIKFETYAQQRIRGAILDYMRQQDWIPTSMRKEIKLVKRTYEDMTMELQRAPEYEEIAERLNMPPSKVERIFLNDYQYSLVHFEDMVSGVTFRTKFEENTEQFLQDDHADWVPGNNLLEQEARDTLAGYIRELSENEQLVLELYYVKELTLKEIAAVIGRTESRISQIHKQAIEKLTARYLKGYENGKE